ncbi:glycosyl transferase, family 2 [Caldicellulosiruptor saccharolyticus DSM 8903]|uniref:Glycosyl transferase, family 2 n=1 Tax=Caldicellulosiruptor saccharolyticus (strain ATCC 43494 / DSM 8903 / Tp8T 6331) TaxID=351627 RepID=A4XMK5_CALS8|nr:MULTISPECIES: glycosyltransferase family 2 protein [Caldicellulosiruptor]ABP68140.1 glycosyl transferase, family 2 [Caldicellulosiruptor saccharolyticus DSM 8903]
MIKNITCVILTKNSARNIENIRNVYHLFEKIVIVDDYSEDDTVKKIEEIDTEKRVKICRRKLDNFSSQRNYASSLAETDWVFHLDSDERIDDMLIRELHMIDGNINNTYFIAFKVKRKNYFIDMHIGTEDKIRLFNKKKLYFRGEVHEDLDIKSEDKIGIIKGAILHKSYQSIQGYFRKLDLYMKLEEERLKQREKGWFYILGRLVKRTFEHFKTLIKNVIANKSFLKPLLWFCLCEAYDLLYFSIFLYVKYFKISK